MKFLLNDFVSKWCQEQDVFEALSTNFSYFIKSIKSTLINISYYITYKDENNKLK